MTTANIAAAPQRAMTLHQVVAANVRAELGRSGLNGTHAAEHLAISRQGMSERLRGITPLSLDELDVLAALFRMSPADLVSGIPGPGGEPDHEAAMNVVRRQGLEPRTRWLSAARDALPKAA